VRPIQFRIINKEGVVIFVFYLVLIKRKEKKRDSLVNENQMKEKLIQRIRRKRRAKIRFLVYSEKRREGNIVSQEKKSRGKNQAV